MSAPFTLPPHPGRLATAMFCALAANILFCLGPLIDGYLTWFGLRHRVVTICLFVLGTGAMLILAAGVAVSAFPFHDN